MRAVFGKYSYKAEIFLFKLITTELNFLKQILQESPVVLEETKETSAKVLLQLGTEACNRKKEVFVLIEPYYHSFNMNVLQ